MKSTQKRNLLRKIRVIGLAIVPIVSRRFLSRLHSVGALHAHSAHQSFLFLFPIRLLRRRSWECDAQLHTTASLSAVSCPHPARLCPQSSVHLTQAFCYRSLHVQWFLSLFPSKKLTLVIHKAAALGWVFCHIFPCIFPQQPSAPLKPILHAAPS